MNKSTSLRKERNPYPWGSSISPAQQVAAAVAAAIASHRSSALQYFLYLAFASSLVCISVTYNGRQ
jgi:hypothetical protein